MSKPRTILRAIDRFEHSLNGTKFDPGWNPNTAIKTDRPGYWRNIKPQCDARRAGTHRQTSEFIVMSNGQIRNPSKVAAKAAREERRKHQRDARRLSKLVFA
jgi:hypothetical protein